MSEFSFPFTGGAGGDSGPYSASFFAGILENLFRQKPTARANASVLLDSGNGTDDALQVTQTSPLTNNIEIKEGMALIQGYYYYNDSDLNLPISANTDGSGFDRIDIVALEIDFINQVVRATIVEGTPAGVPVAPTLTKNTSIYQVPIAEVSVANLFTIIVDADIDNTVKEQGILWSPEQGGTGIEGGYTAGNLISASGSDALVKVPVSAQYKGLGYSSSEAGKINWIDQRPTFFYSTTNTALPPAFATVTINTILDPAGNVSLLSSNQFTLVAGVYELFWSYLPFSSTTTNVSGNAKIQNVTDAVEVTNCHPIYASVTSETMSTSLYPVIFTTDGTKVYELQAGRASGGTGLQLGSSGTTLSSFLWYYGFALRKIGE